MITARAPTYLGYFSILLLEKVEGNGRFWTKNGGQIFSIYTTVAVHTIKSYKNAQEKVM